MTFDPATTTFQCNLCDDPATGTNRPLPDVFDHLLSEHGINLAVELERWPDGWPVVIDTTLEPADFEQGPGA